MSYQYWVIRFVPNVARGEFTNIGLVCGRDGGDWAVRFDTKHVCNRGTLREGLPELEPWITWLTQRIEQSGDPAREGQEITSGWMNHMRARQANAVQFSEPNPVAVPTATQGIELLFPLLVARPEVADR